MTKSVVTPGAAVKLTIANKQKQAEDSLKLLLENTKKEPCRRFADLTSHLADFEPSASIGTPVDQSTFYNHCVTTP